MATEEEAEIVLRGVCERVAQAKPGAWIIGGRYDHFALDAKRHPYREELDAIAPDNPVFLEMVTRRTNRGTPPGPHERISRCSIATSSPCRSRSCS